ncbi:MAG: hypothetical protein EOM83_11570 [Clostridia bacterium]|nr:hypothetical protein [Clostridia bacterium]
MDNNKNIHNIDDDFLKRLIKLSAEEQVSAGFTQKVMQQLPDVQEQAVATEPSRRWVWFVAGVAVLAAIFFGGEEIISRLASVESFQVYRQLFGSVIGSFSKGFSTIHISSIGVLIIIATGLLYLTNLLLRRWFDRNPSAT